VVRVASEDDAFATETRARYLQEKPTLAGSMRTELANRRLTSLGFQELATKYSPTTCEERCCQGAPAPYCSTQPRPLIDRVCFLKYGCDCEIMSPSAAIRKVTANAASCLPPFGRQGDELSPFP
jgi:hypothetical protein